MATLKIYVTNLGKYNEGELIGEWMRLPADDDECGAIDIPNNVRCYFDYEAYGRDIWLEGTFLETGAGLLEVL